MLILSNSLGYKTIENEKMLRFLVYGIMSLKNSLTHAQQRLFVWQWQQKQGKCVELSCRATNQHHQPPATINQQQQQQQLTKQPTDETGNQVATGAPFCFHSLAVSRR